MLMNKRPRAEGLFIGPTQAIAENAYDKAVGMIEASADLKRRFRTRDHVKTIEDLVTHTELKIKTFRRQHPDGHHPDLRGARRASSARPQPACDEGDPADSRRPGEDARRACS
jgi:hypothetical protein